MEALGLGYFEIILAVISFLFLTKLRYDNGLPWNYPLVGMMPWLLAVIHRPHEICAEYLARVGGTFLIKGPWFANMDMLVTADPANVRYILSNNFLNFQKGHEFMEIFDILGDGIVNSEADSWRNQRKHAQILLNCQHFRQFVVKTSREVVENKLIPVLDHISKQGLVVDIQELFQRLSFDTSCMFITGYDPGSLSTDFPKVPFSKAMDESEEVIFARHVMPRCIWKLLRFLDIGSEKKMSKAKKTIDNVLYTYVSSKRKDLSINGIKSNEDADIEGVDLLTLYLTEKDESLGLEGNDKFVRDIVLNHILAGRDTTSSALTWFLWLVITHPEVEAEIRAELKALVPENEYGKPRLFSPEELTEVPYLNGALSEALRLYPPVPFQHKEPIKPDILPSGHRVYPKLRVMFSLYAMGRMVLVWGKDCLEFKPERWITEHRAIKHVPAYKFSAFSAGPRTCLGKRVAYTQLKEVAATLIHNYNTEMVEGHSVEPNLSMILYIKEGLKVRVTNRWC